MQISAKFFKLQTGRMKKIFLHKKDILFFLFFQVIENQ